MKGPFTYHNTAGTENVSWEGCGKRKYLCRMNLRRLHHEDKKDYHMPIYVLITLFGSGGCLEFSLFLLNFLYSFPVFSS